MNILVLNGVNLNMLGQREPDIYGSRTLLDLQDLIEHHAKTRQVLVECKQTNHEGELVEWIQTARADGIIINPGAWTHYSYAIRDAISSVPIPVIEVHISDITKREGFRQNSVITDVCTSSIMGLGFDGYLKAIDLFLEAK